MLPSILEEGEDIVTDDDTGLAGQNVLGTHFVETLGGICFQMGIEEVVRSRNCCCDGEVEQSKMVPDSAEVKNVGESEL